MSDRDLQAEFAQFPEEQSFNAYLDRILTLMHAPGGNGLARHLNRR